MKISTFFKNILFLAILFTVVHFIFLLLFFKPAISTPDAQGYFTQAKLISKEGKTYIEPESILEYIGPHWLNGGSNRYYTTFPPGFPTILSLVYKVINSKAALYVNPVLASLSLFGLFLVLKTWIGDIRGLLALALLSVNPFFNEHALFGDSHISVVFLLIWGLFFLFKWKQTNSDWWIFPAGLCFGIIPTIRYAEILLLFAFAIFILMHFQKTKMFWLSLLKGITGAGIPVIALLIRNQVAFGAFWKTGYGISDEPAHFGLNYFISHFLPYLKILIFDGAGVIFIVGLFGLAHLIYHHKTRKMGIFLSLLIFPSTFLYMAYIWPPDPQTMRFLLPTVPVYIISTVWILKILTKRNFRLGLSLSILIIIFTFIGGLPRSIRSMEHLKNNHAVLSKITEAVEKFIAPGNVLIANEGILQNIDFTGHWKLIDISFLKSKKPESPQYFKDNENLPLTKKFRNINAQQKYTDLKDEELFDSFSKDVWQWAKKNDKVYLIGKQEQISRFEKHLSPNDAFTIVAEIELPKVDNIKFPMPPGRRPPKPALPNNNDAVGQKRMMPNQIFDLILDGRPLIIVEWNRILQ
ncbi:glycosyltransferase family 39 protein [bacterium]|nr:glycosyltransferase family 39 protein [bacterium]